MKPLHHSVKHQAVRRIGKAAARLLRRGSDGIARWLGPEPVHPPDPAEIAGPTHPEGAKGHRVLVAGWFSFPDRQATFGDTEAMRVVVDWLEQTGLPFDVACDPSTGMPGLPMSAVDPGRYSVFVFVCGPWRGGSNDRMLKKFAHCRKIGIDLSPEDPWAHGFDVMIPRDMLDVHNPDLVFASSVPTLPLVGIIQIRLRPDHPASAWRTRVQSVISEYLAEGDVAPITLDTVCDNNPTGIESAVQLENIIGRLDAVITTRMHGLVFALKKGVPVVAIDTVPGGGKVSAQAQAVGWPLVLSGEDVNAEQIRKAVNRCLETEMREAATQVKAKAAAGLEHVRKTFTEAFFPLQGSG
jgi:hypothetical protein